MEARTLKVIFILISLVSFNTLHADTYRGLVITPEVNSPAYDRDNYKHWVDADNNVLTHVMKFSIKSPSI